MKYFCAGESHGKGLVAVVTGVPAGLAVSEQHINADLRRRQAGFGRGGRQQIEKDSACVLSGIRFGKTIGSNVSMLVKNDDWQNWEEEMQPFGAAPSTLTREVTPRPGHGDLEAAMKTNTDDCRNVIEYSSARSTAICVAASGIAREFLAEVGVEIFSYTTSIGRARLQEANPCEMALKYTPASIETSCVRCPDAKVSERMKTEIETAMRNKDSLGGTFRVVVSGLLPGIGGFASCEERLSSQIASAMFGIPSVKGVEFGLGFEAARMQGSAVQDEIALDKLKHEFIHKTNNAGGIECGLTTGMPLIVTCALKPIPTLMQPLETVNLDTLENAQALKERSDVCAVPAAGVVGEAKVAFVLANAYLKKFGCDNMADIKASIQAYKQRLNTMAR